MFLADLIGRTARRRAADRARLAHHVQRLLARVGRPSPTPNSLAKCSWVIKSPKVNDFFGRWGGATFTADAFHLSCATVSGPLTNAMN
jgi:hypothetical protein